MAFNIRRPESAEKITAVASGAAQSFALSPPNTFSGAWKKLSKYHISPFHRVPQRSQGAAIVCPAFGLKSATPASDLGPVPDFQVSFTAILKSKSLASPPAR